MPLPVRMDRPRAGHQGSPRLASAAQRHHHPPPRGVATVARGRLARARRNNAKLQCKYMACEWTQMEICCTQSRAQIRVRNIEFVKMKIQGTNSIFFDVSWML